MKNVMEKAQELAAAIVDSEVYQRMHRADLAIEHDEAANKAIMSFMEKRQAVENLLASDDMNHDALAEAGKDMEAAEKAMNEIPSVAELQESRRAFSDMMENVNRILRLVITGEPDPEQSGCTGSCANCSGCHH